MNNTIILLTWHYCSIFCFGIKCVGIEQKWPSTNAKQFVRSPGTNYVINFLWCCRLLW